MDSYVPTKLYVYILAQWFSKWCAMTHQENWKRTIPPYGEWPRNECPHGAKVIAVLLGPRCVYTYTGGGRTGLWQDPGGLQSPLHTFLWLQIAMLLIRRHFCYLILSRALRTTALANNICNLGQG